MKGGGEFHDYLEDMLAAAEKVAAFISGMDPDAFLADERTQFAVVRAIEILGEASKKVTPAFKADHPELPWREMAGMRDKLIHDYFGVNAAVVWRTATEDVPGIAAALRRAIG